MIFNVTIDLWQSQKASSALAALKKGMAPQANALRDGKYQTIDAATLVPGDIIKIRLGLTLSTQKTGWKLVSFSPFLIDECLSAKV